MKKNWPIFLVVFAVVAGILFFVLNQLDLFSSAQPQPQMDSFRIQRPRRFAFELVSNIAVSVISGLIVAFILTPRRKK